MPSRSKTKSAPSKVGYRNPPVQAQFKKGQSGNPAGRSRRPRSLTEALLEDFLASWERHGVSVLERVAKRDPAARTTRTSRAGSTTTVTSIGSNCSRPCTGSMPMSFAGRVASTSACAGRRKGRASGWLGFVVPVQISSPTGLYVMATAEHREPCESRGSRTVLGARGGAIPPRDSTCVTSVTMSKGDAQLYER